MRNELALSTGVRTDYKIRLAHLEDRLMYSRGVEDKVIPQLESILLTNGLSSSSVDVILHGDELNTNYFREKLTKKFPNVFGVGSSIESKILKLIFADISSNGYKLNSKNRSGHIENAEKTVPVSVTPPVVKTPPVVNTPPIVNTPPKVTLPPVVKVPPVPTKNNIATTENKPEVKAPPIIKPEVKLPPIIKEVKKVDIPLPPPLKGKIPPPPPPPPPIKKK
jgi:hypothetical protein